MDSLDRIKSKIAKLFRLAEGSSNEHEAASAMQKARRLMDEYDLSKSEVYEFEDGSKVEFDVQDTTRVFANVPRWMDILSVAVARMNDCHSRFKFDKKTFKANRKKYGKKLQFMGYKHDVEMAVDMYASLVAVINRLCKEYLEEIGHEGKYPVGKGNAFKFGCSSAICRRLRELTKEREKLTVSSGTGLVVLKSRHVEAHFGKVNYTTGKAFTCDSDESFDAYKSGKIAGESVELQKKVN